jgi:hypothetical protein
VVGSDAHEPDGTAIIRAWFSAHNEGRLDDMLRLLDPAAIWVPASPTGRSFYLGRDATVGLFTDLQRIYGEHRIECHEFERLPDAHLPPGEHIRVTGSLVRTSPDADPAIVAFSTTVTIRGGLIAVVATEPGDLRSAETIRTQQAAPRPTEPES